MPAERIIDLPTANIRFGPGATREIGYEFAALGARRVLVFTDPRLVSLPPVVAVRESLEAAGVEHEVYDRVRVEPSDESFQDAVEAAGGGGFDAFAAVGGGSTIDTAKAANLYATYPAELLEYVNPPIGRGKPVPGPLKPLIAVPTTAGTGSEITGIAIFDYKPLRAKTGIAHRRLKPTLGILDPLNTATLPPEVAASAGLDVLSHAVESYTALPYTERPAADNPGLRPAYQGSNPISDVWALEALRIVARCLPRAVEHPDDEDARGKMLLAAAFAGLGFGNAGCHLPHGMSYPVSGMVRDYRALGYDVPHPLVPHGVSVILNAPAAFRFTASACPERHLQAAAALGADVAGAAAEDAGSILADQILAVMRRLNTPNGLADLGYGDADIPALVKGTLPQHRVTKLSPRPASEDDLAEIFAASMRVW